MLGNLEGLTLNLLTPVGDLIMEAEANGFTLELAIIGSEAIAIGERP